MKLYTLTKEIDGTRYYLENLIRDNGKLELEFTSKFQDATLITALEDVEFIKDTLKENKELNDLKIATIKIEVE